MDSVRADTPIREKSELIFSSETIGILLENCSDLITIVSADGTILYQSPSSLSIFGLIPEECIGRNLIDLVHPDEKDDVSMTIQTIQESSDATSSIRFRLVDNSGFNRSVESKWQNQLHNACIRGILINARLEQRQHSVEYSIEESMSILQSVLEATDDGIVITDLRSKIVGYNKKLAEMWEIPTDALDSYSWRQLARLVLNRLKDPDGFARRIEELRYNPNDSSFDAIEFKDGRVYERYSIPHKVGEATVGRIFSYRDISDRRFAEKKIIASEEKYRLLVDSSADAVVAIDSDLRISLWNPAAESIFGYSEKEAIGREITIIFPKDSPELIGEFSDECLNSPDYHSDSRTVELVGVTRDGEPIPIELSLSIRKVNDSWAATAIARDITERKQSQWAIRRLASFPSENPHPVIELDADGNILYMNPATDQFALRAGLDPSEIKQILPEDVGNICRKAIETSCDYERVQHEVEDHLLEWMFHPVPESSTVHAHGRDMTEIRKLEAQLQQSQKLEAIGTLAGGIAHDFNNQLTGILGHADLLRRESEPGSEIHEAAEIIEMAAQRAARLTQQLLGFARKGKRQSIPIDIHTVIDEVSALLNRTIDRKIGISKKLSAQQPWIIGDPDQLHSVLLNIGVNARDAMPDGGELIIETRFVELDKAFCDLHPGAKPGPYVGVSITDTGTGIPESIINRIFEPFFTTKKLGKGTGMGLAMVYGVVHDHDGLLDVKSRPGEGTTFDLMFSAEQVDDVPRSERRTRLPDDGVGKILVVDDEEVVRKLAKRVLTGLGYSVITASDGQEAIEIYRKQCDNIDLAIIDLIMPRLSGRDCFRSLKKINPDVRTLLSTGCDMDGDTQALLDEGMCGIVQKPYQVHEFASAVADALKR